MFCGRNNPRVLDKHASTELHLLPQLSALNRISEFLFTGGKTVLFNYILHIFQI